MKIYILSFNDSGNYCAYTTFEKAKEVLWECYCEDVDEATRTKYLEEDLQTLEEGFITDYGYIDETVLVEE